LLYLASMSARAIAIIEDDEAVRSAFSEALRDEGYAVMEFSNGREALETILSGRMPSLILCDLVMPEMNGWEFLEAWSSFSERNQDAKEVPVAVVSATPDYGTLEHRAVRDVLGKPVGLDALIHFVDRHFAPRSASPV
jgi:CheY-like chemotaxis protein